MANVKASLRKSDLLIHITFAIGWLGSVAAYLALAIAGWGSADVETARAAYVSMELVGWYVIVPLSLVAVAAGLVQGLTTEWGLVRHYWLAAKFFLTTAATTILLLHMPTVSRAATLARSSALFGPDHTLLRLQLVVHAGAGVAVLLTTTVLSIYKPWGRTKHGKRVQQDKARRTPPAPGQRAATSRNV